MKRLGNLRFKNAFMQINLVITYSNAKTDILSPFLESERLCKADNLLETDDG